jgi:DMSO/TMAO reductase YedYZ heme-binding membrane subunit
MYLTAVAVLLKPYATEQELKIACSYWNVCRKLHTTYSLCPQLRAPHPSQTMSMNMTLVLCAMIPHRKYAHNELLYSKKYMLGIFTRMY